VGSRLDIVLGNEGYAITLLPQLVFHTFAKLTPRLTYRRRGGRWSADKILGFSRRAERKTRAAVM
jgi:hypothetical protein